MANQVAPRLSGDDYQHLYSWLFVLELKMPRKEVQLVTIEDERAGSMDDVTVQSLIGSAQSSRFYQIKYHVDHRGEYSSDVLLENKDGRKSLWEKFWESWQLLRAQDPNRVIELHLLSNWTWDSNDKFRVYIDGDNNSIKGEFLLAHPKSEGGLIRERLQDSLGANNQDFAQFVSSLRFSLGYDCRNDLENRTAERMEWMGLKSDVSALKIAIGIVRHWIQTKTHKVTLAVLDQALRAHDLYKPQEAEKAITVFLTTIKDQKFEIEPDYMVDWRHHFQGTELKKGHHPKDPEDWNRRLLPELEQLEARINIEHDIRLIRARGLARLSAWSAFGYVFSEVARYTIEVDQTGKLWRTDAPRSKDFEIIVSGNGAFPEGEILDGEGETVAVGISITGSLDDDVRAYLGKRTEKVAALLLLRPERNLGSECVSCAGDVVALAHGVKDSIRAFVKKWKAKRLLLFYFGPLSGACFIGHRLNAVCEKIQILEDQQPGYAPSFILQ